MKSIKPGRGPSFLSGVTAVVMGIIGIAWAVGAAAMGAPAFFTLFGVLFTVVALIHGIYSFLNATKEKRFSEYDITDEQKEPDPLNERFGPAREDAPGEKEENGDTAFCPYCGERTGDEFAYCAKCGRKLPR